MISLRKNDIWDLVPILDISKHIGCKWILKNKIHSNDTIEMSRKGQFSKGYSQVDMMDFNAIFSLVANLASINIMLSITKTFDFDIEQMGVKQHSLKQEIYMTQPKHYVEQVKSHFLTN